jgi:hypothetical protein
MKLSLDIERTTMMETHYIVYGVEDITMEEALELIPNEELQLLSEAAKRKIVVRGGKKKIVFKCPKGMKLAKRGSRTCKKMSGGERIKLSRRSRRSARKARSKRARALRKRKKSMRRRALLVRGKKR